MTRQLIDVDSISRQYRRRRRKEFPLAIVLSGTVTVAALAVILLLVLNAGPAPSPAEVKPASSREEIHAEAERLVRKHTIPFRIEDNYVFDEEGRTANFYAFPSGLSEKCGGDVWDARGVIRQQVLGQSLKFRYRVILADGTHVPLFVAVDDSVAFVVERLRDADIGQ